MTATADLHIAWLGGNCPVQAEGTIGGLPFYFRARGEDWSFSVAKAADGDPVGVFMGEPGFYYEEEYPGGEFAAGWMEEDEARTFIAKAADLYRAYLAPGNGSRHPDTSDGEGEQSEADRTKGPHHV